MESGIGIVCAAWCVCIYGVTQGVKQALAASSIDPEKYGRFTPMIPIAVGIASGFFIGPHLWQQLGVEMSQISGGILAGSGAGASAAWVYGFVKHTIAK